LWRKKKIPQLTRAQVLKGRPLKNPSLEWEKDEEGNIVITVRRREDWKTKLLSLLFVIPKERKVALDEVGTLVWELCDGQTTVEDIIKKLMERYKLNRREAELSLGEYLKTLTKRGLVGLQVDLRPAGEV